MPPYINNILGVYPFQQGLCFALLGVSVADLAWFCLSGSPVHHEEVADTVIFASTETSPGSNIQGYVNARFQKKNESNVQVFVCMDWL